MQVSGSNTSIGTFAKQEIIDLLFKCGKRFLVFLKDLRGDDFNYLGIIKYTEETAETAEEALKQ
jgi:hypothetical protein